MVFTHRRPVLLGKVHMVLSQHGIPVPSTELTVPTGARMGHAFAKDTGGALRATDEVQAGGDDVGHLASARQVLADHHLEEVEGRVQAVLVQLQLAAQVVDLPFPWRRPHHSVK